uniref:Pentatricopeptide repeat-containing protein n=1 Tax=Cucumis melo TaxID=3656 RepID=A0A9I9CXS9_CUCME
MAYTLTVQNYMVTVNGQHECSKQEYASTGIGQCLLEKEKLSSLHLNCLCKSSCISSYSCHWSTTLGFGRKQRVLHFKGLQRSVCIDRVDNTYEDELVLNGHEIKVERNFAEKMTKKRISSHNGSSLYLDGPFVGNDEQTNNEILQKFCNKGKLMEASRLVDIMASRNQIPDFHCCVNLIRGFVKIDRIDKAVQALKIMVMSGGVPDVITYNMVIGGLCKQGHLESAIELLDDMSLSGCPPDVITYNAVIRHMFDNGCFDQAIEFWKEQLRKGTPPYLITYTILIELVWKHRGTVRAIEGILKGGHKVNSSSYRFLVHELCINKKVDLAIQVLEMMLSSQCKPNETIYSTIINSIASSGLKEQADELRQKLIELKVLGKKAV